MTRPAAVGFAWSRRATGARPATDFFAAGDRALVAPDVVLLDHLEPALLLALLVGGEVLRRAGQDLHVELLDELLRDVWRAYRPGDLGMHPVDDRPRRAGRGIDAPPGIGREAFDLLLDQGWRVGQRGSARLAGDGDRPQLVGPQVRTERGQALDADVGDAGQEILVERPAALVGDQVEVDVVLF